MEIWDRILILGSTGLVGRSILRKLKSLGYTKLLTPPHHELDLTIESDIKLYFQKHRPNYVFLAAAKVGGILDNNNHSAEFIYQNLKIQSNVIHTSHLAKVTKLLFLGSSCIYPKHADQPIKEEFLLTGPLETTNEAYAIAKIAGIKMCQAYRKQYGTNFISVMPTNLYGPWDNFDPVRSHVLPALIRKFHQAKPNRPVSLWGDGLAKRELLYVDDLAEALILLMKNYDNDSPINVGYGIDYTIKELALIIQDIVGHKGEIIWDLSKPNGTPRKLLDSTNIRKLGWSPKTTLEDGIRDTYHWFLKNLEKIYAPGIR